MDDVAIRAITIGASVLIALITISAVLTYYTAAKDMVRQIGSGTDIAGLYEKSIEEILLKDTITGTELKNLINYFSMRNDIDYKVRPVLIAVRDDDGGYSKISDTHRYTFSEFLKEIVPYILPNQTFKLEKDTRWEKVIDIRGYYQ